MVSTLTAASSVKKIGRAGSCNFPTANCKFPTEEIMGAHNFNFAPKFTTNGKFSAQSFAFLEVNFLTKENVPTRQNLGWVIGPPVRNAIASTGPVTFTFSLQTSYERELLKPRPACEV